jgi:hypothetical protein
LPLKFFFPPSWVMTPASDHGKSLNKRKKLFSPKPIQAQSASAGGAMWWYVQYCMPIILAFFGKNRMLRNANAIFARVDNSANFVERMYMEDVVHVSW